MPSSRRIAYAANSASVIDRKSTRLNSSHSQISYAVFCLTKNSECAVLERGVHLAAELCGCGGPLDGLASTVLGALSNHDPDTIGIIDVRDLHVSYPSTSG